MSNPILQRQSDERVGQMLGRKWHLERLLGVGGMAAVYAAKHRNGKRGAVKLLHPEVALNPDARQRFLREGYLANRVQHPGAVNVLDDDTTEDGQVYLVMELLEGESIDTTLERLPGTRLDERMTVSVAIDVLDILASAHEKGIVHRDIKPDNIFVTNKGVVKVLDFGIARLRESNVQSNTATLNGSVMGTPAFMAPEQALGEWHRVDHRTDIWAVGATMFAMLTGREVHLGESPNKVLLSAMTKAAEPLAACAPVRPELAAIVDRALSFDREARWPSAAEMRDALRALGVAPFTTPAASAETTDVPAPAVPAVDQKAAPHGSFDEEPVRTIAMEPTPQSFGGPISSDQSPTRVFDGAEASVPAKGTLTSMARSGALAETPPSPASRLKLGIVIGASLAAIAAIGIFAFGSKPTEGTTGSTATTSDQPVEAAASAEPTAEATATTTAAEPVPPTTATSDPIETSAPSASSAKPQLSGRLPVSSASATGAWPATSAKPTATPEAPSAEPKKPDAGPTPGSP